MEGGREGGRERREGGKEAGRERGYLIWRGRQQNTEEVAPLTYLLRSAGSTMSVVISASSMEIPAGGRESRGGERENVCEG